jgi:hypothetical protein
LSCGESASFTTLSPNISESGGFLLNQGSPTGYMFMGQTYFDVGHTIVTSSDTISTSNLQTLVTPAGYPANLGPNGVNGPTGVQPTLLFNGNASTFPVNQGYGGAFSLVTGNGGKLTTACSSPTGAQQNVPYCKWAVGDFLATSGTSLSVAAQGNTITAGDFLMIACGVSDSSNVDTTGILSASGFTSLVQNLNANSTFNGREAVLYKWATGSEPSSYSVAFNSLSGDVECTLLDYGNVIAVDTSSETQTSSTLQAATLTVPSTTLLQANELLVFVGQIGGTNHTGSFQPPANFNQRFNSGWFHFSGGDTEIEVADQTEVNAGMSPGIAWSWTGNDQFTGAQFGLIG